MRQPSLFIGHGSPMNAIANNVYTQSVTRLGQRLTTPKAILCISAHWMTHGGTFLTSATHPRMIYDMQGFPKPLYDVNYPAPGSPELVEEIQSIITAPNIQVDEGQWGFDHGTWSVLVHLYPDAKIPVVQLSMDMSKPMSYHFELARKLRRLRDENILIMGSGNIVHNLRQIRWEEKAPAFDWAVEFNDWYKTQLKNKNYQALVEDFHKIKSGHLSVPTLDHYIPSIYILGAADEEETPKIEYDEMQNASISMLSFSIS